MRRFFLPAAVVLLAAAVGCSGPGAQLTQCQSEKEQLLTTIRDQRQANRQMHDRLASLESRLDESEKELARIGRPGTRLSSNPAGANTPTRPVGNALRGVPGAAHDTKLAWKSPAKPGDSAGPQLQGPTGSSALSALAAKDNRIVFDRSAGTARLNLPIEFADNSSTLTAADKRELDEVARLLKSQDAADLKILVSGFARGSGPKSGQNAAPSPSDLAAARAQAVADYLDRHGIAGERLAVAGAGPRTTAQGGALEPAASSVQSLLAERDAPLIGRGGSGSTLRR